MVDRVGKVDDSFEEATEAALSTSPTIDKNGNFLRYEILINPALYVPCGEEAVERPGDDPH